MHELAVTQSILDTVLEYARENDVEKVLRIRLTIGALNDFKREWIQRYFDYLSRETPAEGAQIVVQRVEPAFHCGSCEHTFEVDLQGVDRVRCPLCSEEEVRMERGQEFFITDMEAV
jgi:hydrogenase nickel incorporation protein HypA/HybF